MAPCKMSDWKKIEQRRSEDEKAKRNKSESTFIQPTHKSDYLTINSIWKFKFKTAFFWLMPPAPSR